MSLLERILTVRNIVMINGGGHIPIKKVIAVLVCSIIIISSTVAIVGLMLIRSNYHESTVNIDTVPIQNETKNSSIKNITFELIKFHPSLKLPNPINSSIDTYSVTNLTMDNKSAISKLKYHKLHNYSNTTNVTTTDYGIALRNPNETITIKYYGYIEYNYYGSKYIPSTKKEIESNSSLLNRTEALKVVKSFLQKHNLSNSSQYLFLNLTLESTNTYTNTTRIDHYLYKFIPTINHIPLVHIDLPWIVIIIDPSGQILRLRVRMCNLIKNPLPAEMKYKDPKSALKAFDNHLINNTISNNITIDNIMQCYSIDKSNSTFVIPLWLIYYDGSSINQYII